jgi:hypothetical protein
MDSLNCLRHNVKYGRHGRSDPFPSRALTNLLHFPNSNLTYQQHQPKSTFESLHIIIIIKIKQQTLRPSQQKKKERKRRKKTQLNLSVKPAHRKKKIPRHSKAALHQRRQASSNSHQQPTNLHSSRSASVPSRPRTLTSRSRRSSTRAARRVVSPRSSGGGHHTGAGGTG